MSHSKPVQFLNYLFPEDHIGITNVRMLEVLARTPDFLSRPTRYSGNTYLATRAAFWWAQTRGPVIIVVPNLRILTGSYTVAFTQMLQGLLKKTPPIVDPGKLSHGLWEFGAAHTNYIQVQTVVTDLRSAGLHGEILMIFDAVENFPAHELQFLREFAAGNMKVHKSFTLMELG